MSLDFSKLQNLRIRGEKTTARCPACAESGGDNKGEHLIINPQGRFGCVVYAGKGPDAKQHRRRIFALCGDRELKPLLIRPAIKPPSSGRSGRPFQSHSTNAPAKTGLLGRLGRAFGSHARRHPKIQGGVFLGAQQNDSGTCVPAVPTEVKAHRPLSEREWAILVRAGAENDPLIISALNLFDATVVE